MSARNYDEIATTEDETTARAVIALAKLIDEHLYDNGAVVTAAPDMYLAVVDFKSASEHPQVIKEPIVAWRVQHGSAHPVTCGSLGDDCSEDEHIPYGELFSEVAVIDANGRVYPYTSSLEMRMINNEKEWVRLAEDMLSIKLATKPKKATKQRKKDRAKRG